MSIIIIILTVAAVSAAVSFFYFRKDLEKNKKKIFDLEDDIDKQQEKYDFVASVINSHAEDNDLLAEYNNLLEKEYLPYANKNDSLAEEAGVYKQLLEVKAMLELALSDSAISQKKIIAICGSFSSGKSSFMNSLFEQDDIKLPISQKKTTAIPTYIMMGESTNITGYSFLGGKVDIPKNIFPFFSHGCEKEFKFNIKDIVSKVIFKTRFVHDFKNICFVDTPGFGAGSNPDEDKKTAMKALSGADALIWCFAIDSGTISAEDLEIMNYIKDKIEIPKYIIANKADLKPNEDVKEILCEVENRLEEKSIDYDGIGVYTSKYKITNQPEEYSTPGYVINKSLIEFLDGYNNKPNSSKEETIKNIIENDFEAYIEADNVRISQTKNRKEILNDIRADILIVNDTQDASIAELKAISDKNINIVNLDEKYESIKEKIDGIIKELDKIIAKDEADIKQAEKLKEKFLKCVRKIFHKQNVQ